MSTILCLISLLLVLICLIFKPSIKLKHEIQTYWIPPLICVILLLLFKEISFKDILSNFFSTTSINPIKILIIFFSMTALSIMLDSEGFFQYIASKTMKFAKNSQFKFFIIIYAICSFLTIFTSNDIIILTFTPIICYFCKSAKIKAMPYLICEFVAANTWSMLLIFGNPTNIYVASYFNINFAEYFLTMLFPTLLAGITSLAIMLLIFKKELKTKIEDVTPLNNSINNKPILICDLICLLTAIILMSLSSYISFEMWYICLFFASFVCIFSIIYRLIHKQRFSEMNYLEKHLPWQLIPFLLSMFVIVQQLNINGFTLSIANILGDNYVLIKYGLSSFVASNLLNNIPMSIFFCPIIESLKDSILLKQALFSTIISSNIGAFFTLIGALAGVMWMNICNQQGQKINYFNFLKYGITISLPTLLVALLGLTIVL